MKVKVIKSNTEKHFLLSGEVIFEKILYVLVHRQEKQMLMNHCRVSFHLNLPLFPLILTLAINNETGINCILKYWD